jgi:hypothetical protein
VIAIVCVCVLQGMALGMCPPHSQRCAVGLDGTAASSLHGALWPHVVRSSPTAQGSACSGLRWDLLKLVSQQQ